MKRDLGKPLASTYGDEPKGKSLSKTKVNTPKSMPTGEQRAAVNKANDKNNKRLNNSEENNLRKKDKFARGLAVGLVGSAAALMAKAIKDKNEYK